MSTVYAHNLETGEFEQVGPGGATTDTTLSQIGKPADAGAVGSAISRLIPLSQKGALNGVAELDIDGKIPVGQLPHHSTTDEVAVGVWIDGKTIYRKVIVYEADTLGVETSAGKINHWAYYNELSNLNIAQYIKAEGMALCYSDKAETIPLWQPIPRVCPDACETYSIGIGDLSSDRIGVLFGTGYTSATIYFIIEYIKNE